MNDMFDNLKDIKTKLKQEEIEKRESKKVDKQKKLQDEFVAFMKNTGVKKLS